MSVLPATFAVVNSTLLRPTRVEGNKRGKFNAPSVSYFNPLRVKNVIKLESVKQITNFPFVRRENPALLSTQRRSSIFICASALSARCAAEQTQTVTRKAPTMTHMPTKDKLPDLDDGGTGFPPRDDGDGGGGGGGGGGNWSGGFFFFGFLAFLGFLKDKESEGPYENNRRR